MNKVAILVDGGFYRRVAQSKWGNKSAEERANEVIRYCKRHLSQNANGEKDELYRFSTMTVLRSIKKYFIL